MISNFIGSIFTASWFLVALGKVWSVILALIVFFVGVELGKLGRKVIGTCMEKKGIDKGVATFVDSVVKYAVLLLIAIIILGLFGIETTSFAAAIASVGVTIGLAMQGSLSNLASGVLILVLHPFHVGDYVVAAGNEGIVTEISMFYTKINTVDNRVAVIPNGALSNATVVNVSITDRRQFDWTVNVGNDADLEQVKALLVKLGNEEPARVADTEVSVFAKTLNKDNIDIAFRYWVPADQYAPCRAAMIEKVKTTFAEAGIPVSMI